MKGFVKLGYELVDGTYQIPRDVERERRHADSMRILARVRRLKPSNLDRISRACERRNKYKLDGGLWPCLERLFKVKMDKHTMALVLGSIKVYRYEVAAPVERQRTNRTPHKEYKEKPRSKPIPGAGDSDFSNLVKQMGEIQGLFGILGAEIGLTKPPEIMKRIEVNVPFNCGVMPVPGDEAQIVGCKSQLMAKFTEIQYTVLGYPAKVQGWPDRLYQLSRDTIATIPKSKTKPTLF